MILPVSSPPSILLLNARSLLNKLDELRVLVSSCSPDCIAVTETWLSCFTPDDSLTLDSYTLFRSDRHGRTGGDVCMYIHDSLKPDLPRQMSLSGIESLTVCLRHCSVLLWCLYIPPNLPSSLHHEIHDHMTHYHDSLLDICPNMNSIICGDFNDFKTASFHQNFMCINRVTSPTRANSFLDQIWISDSLESDYPEPAEVGPPLGTSDHSCVVLRPSKVEQKTHASVKTVFDYRQSNVSNFLYLLAASGFDDVYLATDVNIKCRAFHRAFLNAQNAIPSSKVVFTHRDKPWITPVLKKMIQDRWTAYRTKNWQVFLHLKRKVRIEIMRAKQSWTDRILRRDRHIWNIVRDLQGKKNQYCPPNDDNELRLLVNDLTNKFQRYLNPAPDALPCLLNEEAWNPKIDAVSVRRILSCLRPNQSPGHDGIPAHLLRVSADIICEPLCDIFRSSVQAGKFPEFWKRGLIRPIPKKSNPSRDDFRPITLLPIVSKVFEKTILSSMKNAFINEFGENQHAFRPHGSSTSALIQIHDSITSFMENKSNQGVRVTCLDFSKAFDKLQHHRLVNCLKTKKLNQGFPRWLRSFLAGRHSRVAVSETLGPFFPVRSGIPQGSVLGPYLFAMFIAAVDIHCESALLVKFADDLTLIESLSASNPRPANLEVVNEWSKENNMPLNPDKCQQLLFKRTKDTHLASYDNIRVTKNALILGVTLSNDLKWRKHFDRVTLSANRRLHTLRVLKHFVSKDKLLQVFRASVLSVVLYASPVFGPLSFSVNENLKRLTRRAHRIICDPDCNCSLIPDIATIRNKVACDLFLKCELLDHPLHHLVPPRMPNTKTFRMPLCLTSRRMKSLFPSTCIIFNCNASTPQA